MNKKAVIKTSITYWSDEDECYVTESPMFDQAIGTGDTKEEAMQCFSDMLDDALEYIRAGKIYEKPGRPSKGNVSTHLTVKPAVKTALEQVAADNWSVLEQMSLRVLD